jgi:hypothetical protein
MLNFSPPKLIVKELVKTSTSSPKVQKTPPITISTQIKQKIATENLHSFLKDENKV